MLLTADRYERPAPALLGALGFDFSPLIETGLSLVTTGAELAVQERLAYLQRREREAAERAAAQRASAAAAAAQAERARLAEEARLAAEAGLATGGGEPAAGAAVPVLGVVVGLGLLALLAKAARIF